ncbi:MAG: hypothetical protein ACRDRL_23815 [Sciscionella sp.]
MLALTNTALEVVKAVTSVDEAPEGAGLRIATSEDGADNPEEAGLEISVAAAPFENDQVLTGEGGAVIFLEQRAGRYLQDKVLDAQVDEQGQASFAVGEQASPDENTDENTDQNTDQNTAQ